MIVEDMGIRGTVNFVVRGPDGRVKSHKTVRNKVMNFGIAHIVGRMIDTDQAGFCSAGVDGFDTPAMMKFMGIGQGTTPNLTAEVNFTATIASGNYTGGTTTAGVADPRAGEEGTLNTPYSGAAATDLKLANSGTEYRLERELTIGANQQHPAPKDALGAATTPTNLQGRVMMSATDPNSFTSSRAETTALFQGALNSANTLTSDDQTHTAEGQVTHNPTTHGFQKAKEIINKRVGTRLVYIALFPPNSAIDPSANPAPEIPVTEAGIFNNAVALKDTGSAITGSVANQTMLCRTQFSVVTKQPADSLQITWSIEFSDNTA